MLSKIKTLMGLTDSSKDQLLTLLIEQASEEAKNYCHINNLDGLDSAICQMVVWKYNLLGAEGLSAESYSGVSFSYSAEYPSNIMNQLKKHRRIGVIND